MWEAGVICLKLDVGPSIVVADLGGWIVLGEMASWLGDISWYLDLELDLVA